MEKEDRVFIDCINNMDISLGRFIRSVNFDGAKKLMDDTKGFYTENKSSHNHFVIAEALEVLINHYSDIQSKIPLESDIGKSITKHLKYYSSERSKIKI